MHIRVHITRFVKENTYHWIGAADWISSAHYSLQLQLPAVGQPKTVRQSFEVGIAAAAQLRQQTPEMLQLEMQLRVEEQGQ